MWNQWCHTWGDDQAALEKGKKPEDDEASIDEEFDITSLNQAIQLSKQQATLNSMGLDVGQCSSSGVQDESEMDKDKWALTTVGVQWGPEAPLNVSPIQSQPLRQYSLRKVCQQMPSAVALHQNRRTADSSHLLSTFVPFSTLSNFEIVRY